MLPLVYNNAMPCQPPQFSGVIIYLALKQKNNTNGVEQEDIRVIAIFSGWRYILTHSTIRTVECMYNLQSTCDEWEMRLCSVWEGREVIRSGVDFYFLWSIEKSLMRFLFLMVVQNWLLCIFNSCLLLTRLLSRSFKLLNRYLSYQILGKLQRFSCLSYS